MVVWKNFPWVVPRILRLTLSILSQTFGQKLQGLRPLGFLASDLASDAALGLPLENPLGGLRFTLG